MPSDTTPSASGPPPEAKLDWIYQSDGIEELEGRYDEWATTYDADLGGMDYRSHDMAVAALAEVAEKGASILDAGCGTGLVGLALAASGYVNIVGLDLSAGMLAEAERTGVYRATVHGSFAEFAQGGERFDAAISVGVFTPGHAPAEALDELATCVRPGGSLVIGIRTDAMESMGYARRIEALVAGGTLTVVAKTEPRVALQEQGTDILHEHWTFQVN